jgi:hypothetical protein
MARPRVFISSTFYDLKQVRTDLERFIIQMGYDPILHERGKVAYGTDKKLEEYCYREIDLSDIVISIIGGRYGTGSQHQPYSISQVELKTAVDHGKALYVFVERNVFSEYNTYLRNKEVPGMKYSYVDNAAVYKFIEEVEALPKNNPIATFETAQDITDFLREQWAGLFQRYLQEQSRIKEVDIIQSLSTTAQALNELVQSVSKERRSSESRIQDILLSIHPVFQQLRTLLSVQYRVYFTNRLEMKAWLNARQFGEVEEEHWDDKDYEEWINDTNPKEQLLLKIFSGIFGEKGKLKVFTTDEWNKKWLKLERRKKESEEPTLEDTDIPF